MKKIFFSIVFVTLSFISAAQITPPPCSSLESNQFDFWVGDWNLTYNDTVHATNRITKDMDGCVIYEHFDDPTQKFKGNSWSVYNPKTKNWKQTWVDNQGGYIALTGTFEKDKMTLLTEPVKTPDGKSIQYKMIFYNITAKSFDWNWEVTKDEAKTWSIQWKIHYDRKS